MIQRSETAISFQPILQHGIESQPIDIDQGHEALKGLLGAVQEFQTNHMQTMFTHSDVALNVKAKIDQLCLADGLILTTDNEARYGSDDGSDDGSDRRICIQAGLPMLEAKVKWVEQAAQRSDIAFSQKQCNELASKWLVWHELGHVIQHAETDVNGGSLTQKTLAAGIGKMVFQNPSTLLRRVVNHNAAAEAFPEGFSQMLLARDIENTYNCSSKEANRLRLNLTPQSRIEHAKYLTYYYEYLDAAKVSPGNDLLVKARDDSKYIGYGRPFAPDQVTQVLAMV